MKTQLDDNYVCEEHITHYQDGCEACESERAGIDARTMQRLERIKRKSTPNKARALQIAEIDNERVSRLAAFKLLETVQKERDDARNHADKLAEALRGIQKIAFRHETQYWNDDPRTDRQCLDAIVTATRNALATGEAARRYMKGCKP